MDGVSVLVMMYWLLVLHASVIVDLEADGRVSMLEIVSSMALEEEELLSIF